MVRRFLGKLFGFAVYEDSRLKVSETTDTPKLEIHFGSLNGYPADRDHPQDILDDGHCPHCQAAIVDAAGEDEHGRIYARCLGPEGHTFPTAWDRWLGRRAMWEGE